MRGTGLRRALTASLAVGITLGAVASANAAFPGANGRIAVTALNVDGDERTSDRTDIFTVKPDGTGLTNLTNSINASEDAADWNADGTRIAFTRLATADQNGVWYMNADGTGQTLIPGTGNAKLQSPASVSWSPDGTMVAYSLAVGGIRIVKLDGTVVRTLTPAGLSEFGGVEWSPDGTQLAFDARPDDPTPPEIYRINADGTGSPTRLTDNTDFDTAPDWSPDGTRITWNGNTSGNPVIKIMPADDGDPETTLSPVSAQSYRPAFSPDGSLIAYSSRLTGTDFVLRALTPNANPPGIQFVAPKVLPNMDSSDWQPVEAPAVTPLVVTKTALTRIKRDVEWEVLKSVSTKAGWDAKDGSLRVDYRVEVKKKPVILDIVAFGQITVTNPNAVNAIGNVSDALPGGTCTLTDPVTGDPLGTDLLIKGNGGEVHVNYTCRFAAVPAAPLVNTATVTWKVDGVAQTPVSGTATVDFSTALNDQRGVESVEVTDTMAGDETKVLADELSESKIFRYRKYIEPGKKCESYMNTARLIGFREPEPLNVPIGPLLPNQFVIDADSTSVRVCPPVKDDPSPKDPPVVVIDNGDGPKAVDPKPSDNPKVDVITDPKGGGAKLRVTKTASVKRAAKGAVVTWSITVKNTGKSDLDGVVIRDLLPKGLVAVTDAKAPLQKGNRGKRVVTFNAGDLLRGQSVTVTVATRVGRTGRICNIAQAEAGNARSHRAVACIRIGKPVTAAVAR
ncbi:MAG: hypothetical protein U0237_17320 [Thermoleophilia bacterium]